jgi:hypothetical protein
MEPLLIGTDARIPEWWDDQRVHASHRAMLWKKDPVFYAEFEPEDKTCVEYFWPVRWVDGKRIEVFKERT